MAKIGEHTVSNRIVKTLDMIEQYKSLNAFVAVHRETALEQADRADSAAQAGQQPGLLQGLPLALKDNIDQQGLPCSAGCAAYLDRKPDRDAEVVQKLKQAGAIIVGRTNMHELADGVTSENQHFGPVVNPHRAGYHPGGSSGGSAVAVATGCVPFALGTDTGGSVRIPASLCGVVGFKPSQGLVSLKGVVPLSTSLDHVGPLAQTVAQAAKVLSVMVGKPSEDFLTAAGQNPSGLKIGVLDGFGLDPDPPVSDIFADALQVLEKMNCKLEPVKIPGLAKGLGLLANIYAPEAAGYHKIQLQKRPQDFSREIRADLQRGLDMDPRKYKKAIEAGKALAAEIDQAARDVDLLVSPTTAHPARPIGSPNPHTYLVFTCPFNLTGQPAISVPMGSVDGLPVGLQLIGKRNADATVLSLAAAFSAF
ncbi:MAG: amidase [Deltaproteobacteria bacterium]|nr:amidase [Deltaproteobacteria bacterium]